MRRLFLDRCSPALSTALALFALHGCSAHSPAEVTPAPMPQAAGEKADDRSFIQEGTVDEEQASAPKKDVQLAGREESNREEAKTEALPMVAAAEPLSGGEASTRAQATAPVAQGASAGGRASAAGRTNLDPGASMADAPAPVAPATAQRQKRAPVAELSAKAPAPSGPMGGTVGTVGMNTGMAAATTTATTTATKTATTTPVMPPPQDTVSSAEEYRDYGVNPFTMVAEDRLSTFSIDVDTASYTISRRKLQEERSLPPGSAVRVEEFVNYFKYDYAKPSSEPFSVSMEAMPDPFRPGHHTLRVGVQGKEIARNERPAVHLTFLVDVSGSMASADKLGLAQHSMHRMVDGLREDDTVALATYAGRVAKILDPTSAGDARTIHKAIDSLQSGGSTAMSAGIDIAYDLATRSFEPGHENRVVVLSDGDANVGNTSWDAMLSQIKQHADRGVTLSTIGFGMGNYKDTLMEQLANKGDGNNYYIDSKQQAERVFVSELGGTMVTIARDTKIQVEFNPESVVAYRLVGYENRDIADKDFRNDRVDAGEVGSGHQVTALYDVVLKDGYAPTVATVRMRYEKPGADGVAAEKAFPFADRALKETAPLTSRDTRIAYTAATFAEILRGSPHAAEVDINKLIAFGKAAQRNNKDDAELIALMERARDLGANGGSGAVSKR